jgi:hypothetical protein
VNLIRAVASEFLYKIKDEAARVFVYAPLPCP